MESACIDMGFGWDEADVKARRGKEVRRIEKIRTLADCKAGDVVRIGGDVEYRIAWLSGKQPHRVATLYPTKDRHLKQDGSNMKILPEGTPVQAVRVVP